MKPIILPYKGEFSSLLIYPRIDSEAYIAPGSSVIGDVVIGEDSSVWFNCTLRGDVNQVRIGKRTNIQDGSVVHVTRHTGPTFIGDEVTVGHGVMLHACELKDQSFVGIGAVIMDEAVVESHAMVAAGALVTPGKRVPSGELWAGSPAKFFRKLSDEEIKHISDSADNYVRLSREYMDQDRRRSDF